MNAFRWFALLLYGVPSFIVLMHWIANAHRF